MAGTAITKVSIDASKLDLSRISRTAAGAASGDGFIPVSMISKPDWGDENGKVDLILMDDGTYLIEQDGIGMGHTDKVGYESAVGDSSEVPLKTMSYDFDKVPIASSLADAKAGNYIDPSKILQNEWGTEGSKTEFVDYGDGYYLIVQDGIDMGFTNQEGYDYLNGVSADETISDDKSENIKAAEDSSKDNKVNDINNNSSDDIIIPIAKDASKPGKYMENTEPIVDISGEKIIIDNNSKLTDELKEKIQNHEGGKFLCSASNDGMMVDYYDYDGVLALESSNSISVFSSKVMPEPYIVKELIDMHIDPSLFGNILDIAFKKRADNSSYYNEYMSKYISQNVKDDFVPLSVDFNNLANQLSSKGNGDKFIYNFDNKEIEVHKYEDTFTLDYKKDGHRVIETYSGFDNPELINSRIFTKDGEKYNIYQNGKLLSSELQKINIDSYIGDINKHDADKLNEWYGYAMFQGKSADVYHYENGDISFEFFEEVGKKNIYTYDKNGGLKEKKIEFINDWVGEFPFKNIDILYGAFDKEISISYTPNGIYEFNDLKYSVTNFNGEELLLYSNGTGKVTIENKKSGLKQIIDVFSGPLASDNTQTENISQVSNEAETPTGSIDDLAKTASKISNTISDNSTEGLKKMINNIEDSVKSGVSIDSNKDIQKNVDDLKEDISYIFPQTKDNNFDGSNIKDILEARKNNIDKSNESISENEDIAKGDSSTIISSINDISKIERTSGIRPSVLEDGSIIYNGTYDGIEAQIHEYSDDTFTVDYEKDGNRIIERFKKDGDSYLISNVRITDEAGDEFYKLYKNGKLVSSEIQKINSLTDLIIDDTKKSLGSEGWTADGNYNGKKAEIHGYLDGSYTIDYTEGNNRYIYTYNINNILQNKSIINVLDSANNKYFEYDELGNVITGIEGLEVIEENSKKIDDVETATKTSNILSLGIMNSSNVPSFDELVQNFDGSNLDYINEQKKKGLRYGVDVHEHDGKIDWNEVKNSGIDYATIRCSETYWGDHHKEIALDIDERARENVMNAIDAGIEVSIYTYSAATNEEEAKIEAEKVLEFLDSLPEEYRNKIKEPIVYDYEVFDYKEEKGIKYATRCFGMTPEKRTSVINAFNKYIQDKGYKTMIYTNRSAFENEIDGKSLLDENNLVWIAEFEDDIKYNGDYNMWQYSENGRVKGIPVGVDLNVFYLDDSIEDVQIVDNDIDKIEQDKTQVEKEKILSIQHVEELMNATAGTKADESDGNTYEDLSGTEYADLQGFDQHVTDNVNKAGYGTRDGVVSAMLSMNDYTLATGKRIRYQLRREDDQNPRDPVLRYANDLCFDCSGIVGFCMTKGGYNIPFSVQTDKIYEWAIDNKCVEDIHNGKPGDLLVTRGRGHIQMIVGTYDNGYYIAEETLITEDNGAKRDGLSISKQSFDASDADYALVNMDNFYSNKDNVR